MRRVHDLSAISSRSWLMIQRHAEAALAHYPTHDWDDVLGLLIAGKLQLWTARDSVMMTELVEYPRMTVCRIFLAGGELETLIEMARALEPEAAAIGCFGMEVIGRPGWQEIGKRLGWTAGAFCTKEIGDARRQ